LQADHGDVLRVDGLQTRLIAFQANTSKDAATVEIVILAGFCDQ
jgi:hypothetical protein